MAGKVVDVTMRLIDRVTKPLSGVNAHITASSRQWMTAGRQITRTGDTIARAGRSMTTGITLPIVAAGGLAVKTYAEVDKTMTLVESTMGKTKFAAADLSKAMEEAAASSVFGMDDAAQAALNFARGGWDAKQAAEALAPSMSLAAAQGGDLDTVTSGLMATMNVFKADSSEASRYTDILANACSNSALEINSLVSSMSVAGGTFANSKNGIKEAALALGTFADVGTPANVAANALKTGFGRLASPAKGAQEWLDKLQWSAFDAKGNMKDFATVQSELHDKFAKLTDQEQKAAAGAIFGKNQMNYFKNVINQTPDKVKALSDALDKQGTAQKQADSMMGGFAGSMERVKSGANVLGYQFGKVIKGYMAPFVSKLADGIQFLNGLSDAQKGTIVKVLGMVAAMGPALLIFGKMTSGVSLLVTTIGKFGSALKKAGSLAALVTSPAGIVIGVLLALVVVGVLVVKNWDKIRAAATKVFGHVKGVLKTAEGPIKSLKKNAGELGKAFTKFGGTAGKSAAKVVPALRAVAKFVGGVFVKAFDSALPVAIALFSSFFTGVTAAVKGITGILSGLIQFVTGVFTGDWTAAWEGVKTIFSSAFNALKDLCKAPINSVISLINSALSAINGISVSIPEWVPGFGGKTFSPSIPTIPKLAVGTTNWMGGLAMISERGGEIVDLPSGSRVYPHDESVRKAYQDGAAGGGGVTVYIPKLADQLVIREDADIDRIADALVRKLEKISSNMSIVGA